MRKDASLHAVAFTNAQVGLACGEHGTILRTKDGGLTWTQQKSRVDCQLSDVIWTSPNRALIVGGNYDKITKLSRGVALFTNDAGLTWQRSPDEELPWLRLVQQRSDRSLVAIGDWSNSLLTDSLDSHDQGHSWQASAAEKFPGQEARPSLAVTRSSAELRHWTTAIGTAAPVRDVCKTGPESFCAVGEHGVITISNDAGKTWQVTRGEGRQSAVLVVADSPRTVPWSLVGSEAIEHKTRVCILLRNSNLSLQNREVINQVGVMLGASSVRFLNSSGDVSNEASNWLAIHRPAAVILDESLPTEIQDAFLSTASGTGVARIATSVLDGSGRTTIHRNAMLPKTGVLASDLMLDALHYIAPQQAIASSVSLRYVYDIASERRRDESVTSGLALSQGQMIAAKLSAASRRDIQMSQARMSRVGQIENLANSNPTQFASSLVSLLDQTAKPDQFRTAWTMLQLVSSTPSKRQQRILVLKEIQSRFVERSVCRWAAFQLESWQGSAEQLRLNSISEMNPVKLAAGTSESVPVSPFQVSPAEAIASQFSQSQYEKSPAASPFGVQQASAVSPLVVPIPEKIQVANQQFNNESFTSDAEQSVTKVDLEWEFHPAVLIAREAFRRQGVDSQLQLAEAESASLKRLAFGGQNEWTNLLRNHGPQVVHARLAKDRPRLDGKLDDPCWQSALRSAGNTSRLKVAYDEDYLYVAITLPSNQLSVDSSQPQTQSKIRDHDLSSSDRICVSLDIDRDLMTSMELQFTDAGRTADSIDGNPAWQPTWYVDTDRNENQVSMELAILRRDLVELPITPGESWYISAEAIQAGAARQEQALPEPSKWNHVIFQK